MRTLCLFNSQIRASLKLANVGMDNGHRPTLFLLEMCQCMRVRVCVCAYVCVTGHHDKAVHFLSFHLDLALIQILPEQITGDVCDKILLKHTISRAHTQFCQTSQVYASKRIKSTLSASRHTRNSERHFENEPRIVVQKHVGCFSQRKDVFLF